MPANAVPLAASWAQLRCVGRPLTSVPVGPARSRIRLAQFWRKLPAVKLMAPVTGLSRIRRLGDQELEVHPAGEVAGRRLAVSVDRDRLGAETARADRVAARPLDDERLAMRPRPRSAAACRAGRGSARTAGRRARDSAARAAPAPAGGTPAGRGSPGFRSPAATAAGMAVACVRSLRTHG